MVHAVPNNLPHPISSFIGRERELTEVQQLLASSRLVTLTGAGGSGKTRLAIEVGRAVAVQRLYADGVWLIELASLSDPSFVVQRAASTLNLREQPNQPLIATLTKFLSDKHTLLLLDNCEHLIDACAQLAQSLLQACPHLGVLATSREALNVEGEQIYPVRPLSAPDLTDALSPVKAMQYDAVRLFVERATDVQAQFALTSANTTAVAHICQRLDGIPLAVELAAARVNVLSAGEIAARLDRSLDLLLAGERTALPRHQTMRAVLEWSCQLLSEPERVLFRRLAVFAGGWSLEAAEAVCSDPSTVNSGGSGLPTVHRSLSTAVLDLLTQLVNKSLVLTAEHEGKARYRMLEPVRRYADERLVESGEGEQVRDRHLEFFVALAEEVEPKFDMAEQVRWFNRFEVELDNVRIALNWSLSTANIQLGLRLAASICNFWFVRGYHTEGIYTLQNLLARLEAAVPSLARGKALSKLSEFYLGRGEYRQAELSAHESLAIVQALGDTPGIALALLNLGWIHAYQGKVADAQDALQHSLALFRVLQDKRGISRALSMFGLLALRVSQYERAHTWFAEAAKLLRELGDKYVLAWVLRHWGFAFFFQRKQAEALANFRESLALNVAVDDRRGITACLAAYAMVALAHAQFSHAVRLLAVVEVLLESIPTILQPYDHEQYTRNVAAVYAQLSEKAFNSAWALGRTLTLEHAIALAEQITVEQPTTQRANPPAVEFPAGLTEREVEVLRLVAQGLTDAEIATQLVISPRTVNSHLRSIYGKLDVTTRVAAVRAAIALKLA